MKTIIITDMLKTNYLLSDNDTPNKTSLK